MKLKSILLAVILSLVFAAPAAASLELTAAPESVPYGEYPVKYHVWGSVSGENYSVLVQLLNRTEWPPPVFNCSSRVKHETQVQFEYVFEEPLKSGKAFNHEGLVPPNLYSAKGEYLLCAWIVWESGTGEQRTITLNVAESYAEHVAKVKAEEAAKVKAEEEAAAKVKAEEAAKRKAEEEARAKEVIAPIPTSPVPPVVAPSVAPVVTLPVVTPPVVTPPVKPVVKPVVKPLSTLAKALKQCKKQKKHSKRIKCEKQAKKKQAKKKYKR